MCDAEIQYHLWQGNDLERALVVEGDFRHILKMSPTRIVQKLLKYHLKNTC